MREKKSDEKKERKLDRERERKAEKEGEGEKRRAAGRTGQPHGHTSAARLPLLLFCKCRGGHREVTCAVHYNKNIAERNKELELEKGPQYRACACDFSMIHGSNN